jgi:hypothetical protein
MCKNLTPPIKFKAQKPAAKFSRKCQVRCRDFERKGEKTKVRDTWSRNSSELCAPACSRVVANGREKDRERQRFLRLPHPPKKSGGRGGKVSATLGASLRRSER